MQHLRSLFWILQTILSILSLTGFSLISVKSRISAVPTSYKRLTYKCSFYRNPVHYLTVTKINCIWGKYIYIEAIQITSSTGIYKTIYIIMIVIYGYLDRESDKVFKFFLNKSSFFEISTFFF